MSEIIVSLSDNLINGVTTTTGISIICLYYVSVNIHTHSKFSIPSFENQKPLYACLYIILCTYSILLHKKYWKIEYCVKDKA